MDLSPGAASTPMTATGNHPLPSLRQAISATGQSPNLPRTSGASAS